MIRFELLHPRANHDMLGLIPEFLSVDNPEPAAKQLGANYAHGGGWNPFKGFIVNAETKALKYPGDPAFGPIAKGILHEEEIYIYPHAWVMIWQKDGSHEICRMG